MAKSKQIAIKAAVRHTVKPGISSPIFLKTIPAATCHLRRAEDTDPTRSLKLFSDDEGIICFHVRPSVEAEHIAKFVIECEGESTLTHHPLELSASRTDTPEMPFPARERPPRKKHLSVRPALSREEGLRLSKEELLERGYPPRPDPTALAPFRTWLKAVSVPMAMVKPRTVTNTGVSHGPITSVGENTGTWSGFELRSFPGTFDQVWGDWPVPLVLVGETNVATHSSFWVGIDGDLTDSGPQDLIQAGTSQVNINLNIDGIVDWSFSIYYAWTQFLPPQQYEQVITNLPVNPSDEMSVLVWVDSSPNVSFFVENKTINEYVLVETPLGDNFVLGMEAEWIMERPTVNNAPADLAAYLFARMGSAFAGVQGGFITYQETIVGNVITPPVLQSRQITMKNGQDILSTVFPIDELSMFFVWSGFH